MPRSVRMKHLNFYYAHLNQRKYYFPYLEYCLSRIYRLFQREEQNRGGTNWEWRAIFAASLRDYILDTANIKSRATGPVFGGQEEINRFLNAYI